MAPIEREALLQGHEDWRRQLLWSINQPDRGMYRIDYIFSFNREIIGGVHSVRGVSRVVAYHHNTLKACVIYTDHDGTEHAVGFKVRQWVMVNCGRHSSG